MDYPISKIDIEYLIDAAEKAREEGLPKYISYRLFNKAQETLEGFEDYQTSLFGPAENTAYLEIKLYLGLSSLKDKSIPACPEGYKENDLTILVLVQFYRRYNEDNRIDEIREENYQVLEGRSAMRERILTTAKALRTALKMLSRVERGDTSEENFIQENEIPKEFLQDTEYDDRPDLLPETQLGRSGFQGNMDFLSESDIEYLIDAAHDTCRENPRYLPPYIPYRLSKEAEKMIENQIPTYYTQSLISRIHNELSVIKDKSIPACPKGYKENDSTLQVLVLFYKINEQRKRKDGDDIYKSIPGKFKSLRTALKMLIRLERGITSEKDFFKFLQENELPEEVLKNTEYDRGTHWIPMTKLGQRRFQGNMNVPSKRDIEYLIDAAEKTSFDDDIPKYFPCLLYQEAYEALVRLERDHKCSLIGHAQNNRDLAIKFRSVFSRIKGDDKYFPERPEEYGKNDSTIKVLVECYREYIKKKKIDEIRKEDEKHKKWGTLSANFQKFEARSAMREEILAMSKALRTALKMLCRVERGKTEEDFIREDGIPKEFLQDTEYDGSNETYNIIPFDGRPDLLPEVQEAIKSLKLGVKDFPTRTQGHDVLDCLQKFFGFQERSVSNQRENIVNLLSNELMRLGTPGEQALEAALEKVFSRTLDNYIKWRNYLGKKPIWKNTNVLVNATGNDENSTAKDKNVIIKDKKILYISLYYLIWGEAANVRFLPECLCYIFHRMWKHLDKHLSLNRDSLNEKVPQSLYKGSFIDQVIQPLYEVIAAEAEINKKRDTSHSKWRNYDDFNEYFWSKDCFQLRWPLNTNSPFFQKPPEGSTTVFGKTSFVERRTFLHLYHSFHRLWIFHVMMFEALVIFAFNDGELNLKTLTETLAVTYFLMKLIQSMFDIWLKYGGAYSKTSCIDVMQIVIRFIGFMSATLRICFSHMKCLQEMTSSILGIYAVFKILFSILSHFLPKKYENSSVAGLIKWINQEEYVGGGMNNDLTDIFRYMLFWLVTLGFNFAFTYDRLISPLVIPTRDINIHNMLAIGSLWAGVICAYIVGSHVSYNVTSAVVGTFVGHKDRLGNIKSLGDVHKHFNEIPTAFMGHLHTPLKSRESPLENDHEDVKKLNAAEFSPFWNKIVMNLREEDYISDFEQYALNMPENSGSIDAIHWPPFLLFGKVFHAIRLLQIAQQHTQSHWRKVWNEISRDDAYMKYAVEECFHSVKFILHSVLKDEGKKWVEGMYEDIESSIAGDGNLCPEFQLNELESFVKAISELTEILKIQEDVDNRLIYRAEQALQNVTRHDFLGNKRFAWLNISVIWPEDPELRSQIKRLHFLLTTKSAAHVPRNREARRRLEFFINSLFMSMPKTMPVPNMLSFSVLTPYYEETVLYSLDELESSNDDGVALIDYLKNLYPDEWINYCERMKKRYTDVDKDRDRYEYRLWASYRGQTLARTVRGTMYYQKALLLQAYREMLIAVGLSESMCDSVKDSETAEQMWDALKEIIGSQCLDYAKAHVDLKFTYVVTCQIYGKQKSEGKDVAADIAFLLKKNEGLRVAFIDEVFNKEGYKEFYSNLVKADKNGKEMKVYSIKLPGDPRLGEGKPENQNHAIVFTRGNAIQTIDMNQDNYFEETLKMRNLLEEFHRKDDVIHPPSPTILGIREHIFTGSASSLASFMSNQETGFVTLGQRVIANPLKVRMHYGHPDVFDRVFHITRGGISKASRGINISEDIYAGFNSTLRQGSVTHHEYIQVGKGRDVGFNQIATFEGKVAGGNGEQVLSRDIYRLGERLDFFRMLSFYYTTVGYYFSSLLMVITLYILLYGNLIMALSGTRVPHVLNDTDMAPEWFLMIVLLPAIYMLLVPYLEQGLEKAVESFLAMFFSLGSIFFAFSLGTRIHWFGRTIIHGGASYQATGRGFVLHHVKFSENYRLYSRSHFIKGMEVLFMLVVYCIYGFHSVRAIYNNLLLFGGLILSISWIVAPFLFDSSPFDLKKNSEDREDWNNWLNRKSDEVEKSKRIEEKVKESWEIWWTTELSHIRTTEGRVIETILSLRFFIFPLVVDYKLDMQGLKISLLNCVIPWIFLVGILFAHEFFSNKKALIQFFSYNRVATIGALALAIAYYSAFGDMLAFTIAIITIVWGFISFFSNNGVGTIGALAIVYYYSTFGDKLAFIIAIITTIWGFLSFFSNNRVATIGALAIAYYYSAFGGVLAFFIAIITTVWGFLSICIAWKPVLEIFSLWIPVKYLAWICDAGMGALMFNINVSRICVAWKPTLKRFSLWTPVTYLAWICDTGMGALMFKIANMFSQRSIKQYLLRNMFVHNVSELLHKSSPENASLYGRGF